MTSILSAFPFIGEQSFATPGAFNSPLSILSANIAAINADIGGFSGVTITPPSGNTITIRSALSITGPLQSGPLHTDGPIRIDANSNLTNYLYLSDVSNLRSNYIIGSQVGGTADGLNIWDDSGQTMLASFSKQSIRFFQNVVGPVFDVGGALADTLNAATFGTGAVSTESRIQAAISAASLAGISRVYVPANMYPYSAASVSFDTRVQMVREGGDWTVYDVLAYGASGLAATNDRAALVSAVSGAAAVGGTLKFSLGDYWITSALTVSAPMTITGVGRKSKLFTTVDAVNIFDLTTVSNVRIENLLMACNGKNQTDAIDGAAAIVVDSTSSNILITRNWIELCDDAIVLGNACSEVAIIGNQFKQNSGACVRGFGNTQCSVANNTADGARVGIGNGLSGVNFVWFSSSGGVFTNNCAMVGNVTKNFSFEGFNLFTHRCTIAGNVVDGCITGINLQTTSTETVQPVTGGSYNVVTGNVIRNQTGNGAGIRVGYASPFNTVAGHHNTIVGNLVDTTAQDGIDLAQDASYNILADNTVVNAGIHGIASGVSSSYNQFTGNSIFSSRQHGLLIQGGDGNVVRGGVIRASLQDGIRANGVNSNLVIDGVTVVNSDISTSGSWNNIVLAPGGSITSAVLSRNKCYNTVAGSFAAFGITVGTSSNATGVWLIGNDCRNNKNATNGITISGNPTTSLFGNLEGSNTTGTDEVSMFGDGAVLTPGVAFSSEQSLGLYRSAASQVALSYGQFLAPSGTAVQPALAWTSEASLGLYRSAASVLAFSYGQLAGPTGSSTTPTFGFVGDSDTGMYRLGANFIAFTCGGADLLYLSLSPAGVLLTANGSAINPIFGWNSEKSLGFYRSAVSALALSYGAFAHPDGSSTTPSITYSSNSSLGFYSSGAQTIAQSLGTFNLATNAVRLSMRTIAASALTASAANTNVAVNECVFTVSASGASFAINSAGTTWVFNSDASAKNT